MNVVEERLSGVVVLLCSGVILLCSGVVGICLPGEMWAHAPEGIFSPLPVEGRPPLLQERIGGDTRTLFLICGDIGTKPGKPRVGDTIELRGVAMDAIIIEGGADIEWAAGVADLEPTAGLARETRMLAASFSSNSLAEASRLLEAECEWECGKSPRGDVSQLAESECTPYSMLSPRIDFPLSDRCREQ